MGSLQHNAKDNLTDLAVLGIRLEHYIGSKKHLIRN